MIAILHQVDLSLDYEGVHLMMKSFSSVERIKLRLTDTSTYDCYVTFQSSISADKACKSLQDHCLNNSIIKTSLYSIENLRNDPHDFIHVRNLPENVSQRKSPSLIWHVAAYKDGRENLIKAADCIQNKVGQIPHGNMKRYGRNILIKAGNKTQAVLLTNFKPSDNGNIRGITPHKTFNTSRGVVYSQDLYDFSDEEILNLCPSDVCHVRKMGGSNNTIMLTFCSSFLPEHIDIGHLRIKVKKFRQNPTQCHNCFDYGHIMTRCQSKKKCYVCSAEHETWTGCTRPRFCLHCSGSHSPNSRECPRRKLEQSIVEVAYNEKISIGSAKRQVMGANRDPNSTYASVIKKMKISNMSRKPPQENRESRQNPPKSKTSPKRVPKTAESDTPLDMMSSCESLPDLSKKNPVPSSDPVPLVSESGDDGAKSISVETKSSIITVTKKQANEDGFSVPAARKRARPASPKSGNSGLELSNSFSTLEKGPDVKKQAVSVTEAPEKDDPKLSTNQPRAESCRPKTHTMKEREPNTEPTVKEALKGKPDKETKIPVHSSHHSIRGETRKSKLKDNFSQAPRDKASQSRHDKTGKNYS